MRKREEKKRDLNERKEKKKRNEKKLRKEMGKQQ